MVRAGHRPAWRARRLQARDERRTRDTYLHLVEQQRDQLLCDLGLTRAILGAREQLLDVSLPGWRNIIERGLRELALAGEED